MMTNSPWLHGYLYPEIEAYVLQRMNEFDQIESEINNG